MIPSELHQEVHTALMRRKTPGELWGSPLNNGYVGLTLCSHATKDEITIEQIISYFERNLNVADFLNDPKNLAATALFAGMLGRTGQKTTAGKIMKMVTDHVSALSKKQFSKYSFFNSPELVYFLIIGLKQSGGENFAAFTRILIQAIQNRLTSLAPANIQRATFFLAGSMEVGLDVADSLSDFLTKLNISQLQVYDVIPLNWFLIRYRERMNWLLRDDAYLRGLVSQHSEAAWTQLKIQKEYLSFDPPSLDEGVARENVYILSVLELTMLDDLLTNLELVRGVYPPDLYAMLDLHPIIKNKTEKLFKEGNYNQAIREAYIALVDMVKEKAGHPKGSDQKELDGTALMQQVFSIKNPILKFSEMKSQIEIDEQQGMMYLFSGSVSAVRNVFIHKSRNEQEDPYATIEYLQLASFLAKKLERAIKAR
jgi:uncharacterized protein (TIGR02391 family)